MKETISTHGQLVANGGGVAIIQSWGGIREKYLDGWSVYRVNAEGQGLVTDPKAAWYHHGRKWFSSFGHKGTHSQKQAAALEEAKAWVFEKYGEAGPWVGNRMRDKVPARINKAFPIGGCT